MPTTSEEENFLSQQADETCGGIRYSGRDAFDVQRQIENAGGADAVLDRAIRRQSGGGK
jgi:hypothetical protein